MRLHFQNTMMRLWKIHFLSMRHWSETITENSMNIFALSTNPWVAATMHCDKHVPKMVIEIFQQLGSAVRRHGATDSMMPLTQKGTPLRGGYHNHPCTRWTGDCRASDQRPQIHEHHVGHQSRTLQHAESVRSTLGRIGHEWGKSQTVRHIQTRNVSEEIHCPYLTYALALL